MNMFNLVRNQTPNKIYVLELIKRRSKVHQKNVSRERPVNLVYKIIHNNCCFRLFDEFIQTQKRYPTSLDKITI